VLELVKDEIVQKVMDWSVVIVRIIDELGSIFYCIQIAFAKEIMVNPCKWESVYWQSIIHK
jgi:hypothetical protein